VVAAFAVMSWAGARAPLLALRSFVVEPFVIPSESMAPTLLQGDQFFVVKTGPAAMWTRGDVLVLRMPEASPTLLVKRAFALEGDRVGCVDGRLSLNDTSVSRGPCSVSGTCQRETLPGGRGYDVLDDKPQPACGTPTTVPPSRVYVLGDNRSNSWDSRDVGPVDTSCYCGAKAKSDPASTGPPSRPAPPRRSSSASASSSLASSSRPPAAPTLLSSPYLCDATRWDARGFDSQGDVSHSPAFRSITAFAVEVRDHPIACSLHGRLRLAAQVRRFVLPLLLLPIRALKSA
jgi:signal peptidase I